jgi:hypothetical protein
MKQANLDPLRKVMGRECLDNRLWCVGHEWRLLLECGHSVMRTESKHTIARARCPECRP